MVRRAKKGQGLTEVALVLPILLLVILGIIEGAWVVWAYITVQNAAREAARYAVTGAPLDEKGEPWSKSDRERLEAIIKVARHAASGLPVNEDHQVADVHDANNYIINGHADFLQEVANCGGACYTGDQAHLRFYEVYTQTPQVLGVEVRGDRYEQVDVGGGEMRDMAVQYVNFPGEKGLNVTVEVYYTLAMFDPIYDTILGGRTLNLRGRVTLQNEGINLALGGELPDHATPPGAPVIGDPGDSGGGGTGGGTTPRLEVYLPDVGGQLAGGSDPIPAGSPLDPFLINHPTGSYYLCFANTLLSGGPYNVVSDKVAAPQWLIPETTLPGKYQLFSVEVDKFDGCDQSPKFATQELNIAPPDKPIIGIDDPGHGEHMWPDNSLVTILISGHEPDDAPKTYPISLDGLPLSTEAGADCEITTGTDGYGRGTAECVLTNDLAPGSYLLSTDLASTTVEISNADLVVQGNGDTPDGKWVDDNTINVTLLDHAPNHDYYFYFGNDTYGYQLVEQSIPNGVQVNSDGKKQVSVNIPDLDDDGTYYLVTQDRESPTPLSPDREIARTSIEIFSPTDPIITVVGGYEWPAGEVIDIRLRSHTPNQSYDVRFDQFWVDQGVLAASPSGNSPYMAYKIPVSMTAGTKTITSFLAGSLTDYDATREVDVLASPYLEIAGGDQHAPGERITIRLKQHLPHTSYDVVIDMDGDLTPETVIATDIIMDANGEYEISYDIPLDIEPTGVTNPHPIISRRNGQEVAAVNLYVVPVDLTVTAINLPQDPQPGVPLPITITVRNQEAITLSGIPFDTDLYIDKTPSYSTFLPPGDDKVWLSNIGPNETINLDGFETFLQTDGVITLYGRTDTSNKVFETLEYNNIFSRTATLQCNLSPSEFIDRFANGSVESPDSGSNWSLTAYGDADEPSGYASLATQPNSLLAQNNAPVDPAALSLSGGPAPLPTVQASLPGQIQSAGAAGGADYQAQAAVAVNDAGTASPTFRPPALALPAVALWNTNSGPALPTDYSIQPETGQPAAWHITELPLAEAAAIPQQQAATLKINFQQSSSPVPVPGFTDYEVDTGEGYADRGNGFTYGWRDSTGSSAANNATRDRDSSNSPDQRYDTLNHMQQSGTYSWEIAVPNGDYEVYIVAGDPDYDDGDFRINVEGTLAIDDQPAGVNWLDNTVTVNVSDGQLTIEPASGSVNAKISFIHITPQLAPAPAGCGGTPGPYPAVDWIDEDIGSVAAEGYTGQNTNGSIYVCGSGADIWNNADEFHYAYQELSGDVEIVAQITEWDGSANAWAKGGLMIRESNAANARHMMVVVTRDNGLHVQGRTSTGGSSFDEGGGSFSVPNIWLRLSKQGDLLRAYTSTDGSSWSQIGNDHTMSLTEPFLVGMAVTSHSDGQHAHAVFDNVTVTQGAAPAACGGSPPTSPATGWTSVDLGDATDGYTGQDPDGTIYVCGSGSSLFGTPPDNFRYVYQPVSGDIDFRARLTEFSPGSNGWSKTGLMLRTSAADNAAFIHIIATRSNGIDVQYRPTIDGNTADTIYGPSYSTPVWLRVVKSGDTVTTYNSSDGSTWNEVGSATMSALGTDYLAGFSLASYSSSEHAYARFNSPTFSVVNQPPDAPSNLQTTDTDTETPQFSWSFSDPDAGDTQGGWEIEVGTDTDWTNAEMWSSGQQSGADATATYAGATLIDGSTYYWRIRTQDNNGSWGDWSESQFTVSLPASATCPVQEMDGQIVLEAENYTDYQPSTATDREWLFTADYPNHSGSGAMAVFPVADSNDNRGTSDDGPALLYEMNFAQSGTYHVFVRARGHDGDNQDDSLHVGLDGVIVTGSGYGLTWTESDEFIWTDDHSVLNHVTIDVPSAGVHTLWVWMREDGAIFDKLWLIHDSVYDTSIVQTGDTGLGPAESTCGPSNLTVNPVLGTGGPEMELSWQDNNDDETGFRIERSPNGTDSWTTLSNEAAGTTAYTDNDAALVCGERYYYRVVAFNAGGDIGPSNIASGAYSCPALAPPINLVATAASTSTMGLNWQHPGAGPVNMTYIEASFAADDEGFTYSDISEGDYADGVHQSYVLRINLGNQDDVTTGEMSGEWTKTFNTDVAGEVTVEFEYNVTTGDLEQNNDEYGEARIAIDGDVHTVESLTENADSGWQSGTLTFNVSAGEHTLRLIGAITQKDHNSDDGFVEFDNIRVTATATSVTPTGYELQRTQSITSPTWQTVATIADPTSPAYHQDTGLTCQTYYHYRVRAYLEPEGSYSAWSNIDDDRTNLCVPLPPPTNLVLTPTTTLTGDHMIDLRWEDNSDDEDEYIIERSLNQAIWMEVARVPADADPAVDFDYYTDDTVSCDTTYYYRVRSYRSAYGGAESQLSNIASGKTGSCPATPTPGPSPTPAPTDTPAPTPTPVPEPCTETIEQNGVLTLCSSGSDAAQSDDAGSDRGYMFMHRPVDGYSFEMVARLTSIPNLTDDSMAGLEVREGTGSDARKVALVVRNTATSRLNAIFRETQGGEVNTIGDWKQPNGDLPIWLRIVRANGYFYFYYNAQNDDSPPALGAWSLLGKTEDKMGSAVRVGFMNMSDIGGTTADAYGASRWEQFGVGCVVNALSTCGVVKEESGMVVVDAINYTDNFPSENGSDSWSETSRSSYSPKSAMIFIGDDYDHVDEYEQGPMLEYTVNIETAGDYYVWVLGYARYTSRDSIHLGVNGRLADSATNIELQYSDSDEDVNLGSYVHWFSGRKNGGKAYVRLNQGVHTINVRGREDRFELIQLLLTTDPAYEPPANFVDQSNCLVPLPPQLPPNLTQCTAVLRNTHFEETTHWTWGGEEQTRRSGFPYPDSGTSWSTILPASYFGGQHNAPYLSQDFEMPTWLNNEKSTAVLTLKKAVHKVINPDFQGVNSPNDKLYVVLRMNDGGEIITLTDKILIADGDDTPADERTNIDPVNPDLDSNGQDDWRDVTLDMFDSFQGDIQDVAGKSLDIYFYSPNPGPPNQYSTNFYVDKVELKICTTQPVPVHQPGKGTIEGQLAVFSSGSLRRYQGIPVWAYRIDGGPVLTTYSVNTPPGAPNYGFYNLEPGLYIVFAQYVDSAGFTFVANKSVTVIADQTANAPLRLDKQAVQ